MRIHPALGAFLCAAASGVAAQSSVTMFGVMDLDVRRVRNGDAASTQVSGDGIASSRIGWRGTEDLGGGLSAGFWLESGIAADTGSQASPTKLFNRRSTVSLAGPYGELRLGRDFTPTFWNLGLMDPFYALGLGSTMNLIAVGPALNILNSGALTAVRADNSLGYFLPAGLGGLYGQFMVSAAEDVPNNKYTGGRLGYAAGPIDVAVAFGRTRTAGTDRLDVANVGGSYDLGPFRLTGLFNRSSYGEKSQRNVQVGASIPIGASEIRIAYQWARASGAGTDGDDARQLALGYVYNLSRRTALYATVSHLTNEGKAGFTVAQPPGSAVGRSSSGYDVGIRQSF